MSEKLDILYVDDEEILRTSASRFLTALGYSNKSVEDGQFALEFLAENSQNGNLPRLVITDYDMPRVTGGELVQRARELYPGLSFIIVTGNLEDHEEEFKIEGIPYLRKPYRISALKEKIEENISL